MSTQRNLARTEDLSPPTINRTQQCPACHRTMSERWARTHEMCPFCQEADDE